MPEMQALAERVDEFVGGRTLTRVTSFGFAALKTVRPSPDDVVGARCVRVSRRGKFFVLELDSVRIAIHLSQGGRVDLENPAKSTKPRGAVVRFGFDGRAVLVKEFGTERKAGWWVLERGDDGPMAPLGPDPFDDAFAELVRGSTDGARIHTLLRDQRFVAGIGRGYSDDILHRAQLSPYATLAKLDASQRERLIAATHEVLTAALTGERTRTGGLPAKLGQRFTVHGRAGTPCPACGSDLRRISFESHEIAYCPACQTEGKILADRRMSRLVR
ncbi:MAG TPA: DNA-formamidopyrimidine glycosylase family protein [Actinomycetota bacterium]|nr:DNA-formamidopyrimidine glycosylase family protein [Actinomycetota bacterium]